MTRKHPAESALQSPADLIKAIVETKPARPSDITASSNKLRRALRGDLDTIVAKALKKNPVERYVSVTALADDLRRYLKHEPIGARPDTLAYRAKKFARRNRIPVALAVAVFAATTAGIVATIIQARTTRMERDFALRQLSRAEAITSLNTFVLSDAAPSKKPFTVNDQLAGAEELVAKQKGPPTAIRAELLLHIGEQYLALTQYPKAREVLAQAYAMARALPGQSTRARTSCALAQALSNAGDLPGAEELVDEGLKEIPDDARFALERVLGKRDA